MLKNEDSIPARIEQSPCCRVYISLFLILCTVIAFWGVQNHDFVNFDDPKYVRDNPYLKNGVTWSGLQWAFTATSYASNWHPLTWASHMLDIELLGMNPGRHHVVNLIFHILNSVLLFLLFHKLTKALWRSACVAFLFALHPMHVESVVWISERKDLLYGCFWMSSLLFYARFVEKRSLIRYLALLSTFVLGLLSKPMMVTLPCVLLLLDIWPLRRISFFKNKNDFRLLVPLLVEKIPLFLFAILLSGITFFSQSSGTAVSTFNNISLSQRFMNAVVAYGRYLWKMFVPVDLSPFYPYYTLPMWQVVLSTLVLLICTTLFLRPAVYKRSPYLLIGWLWFLGTLVPVIGLVQVGSQSIADRYTYLPFVGLFVILVWGLFDLMANRKFLKQIVLAGGIILLPALMASTRYYSQLWSNSITLFQHAAEVDENNYFAHSILALSFNEKGMVQETEYHYDEAIRIKPDSTVDLFPFALFLTDQNKLNKAVDIYLRILWLEPDFLDASVNLGVVYLKKKEPQKALTQFQKALLIAPKKAITHFYIANAFVELGNYKKAIEVYKRSIKFQPSLELAHYGLGDLLRRTGVFDEAALHLKDALRINPKSYKAKNSLANLLASQGKSKEAQRLYEEALMLNSEPAVALFNLGSLFVKTGKPGRAIDYYKRYLKLKPSDVDVKINLGVAFAMTGKLDNAIEVFNTAFTNTPKDAEIHNNLGIAYKLQKNFPQASSHFSQALRIQPGYVNARNNLNSIGKK